jgi:hypothetical protein
MIRMSHTIAIVLQTQGFGLISGLLNLDKYRLIILTPIYLFTKLRVEVNVYAFIPHEPDYSASIYVRSALRSASNPRTSTNCEPFETRDEAIQTEVWVERSYYGEAPISS